MNIAQFPCYHVSDQRSGITIHVEANRYKRVVRFDSRLGVVRLVREEAAEFYASPAKVLRFPIERTRSTGEL